MRILTKKQVLALHGSVLNRSGGSLGIRDEGLLESALGQPFASFDGKDLYPTIAEKAASLMFSVVSNHLFVDGNKRTGHAAMATFLLINGYDINFDIDEQEAIVLRIAAGQMSREELSHWLASNLIRV